MLVHKCNFLLQFLLKINAYFSRFYCNKNLPYLCVFSSFRTGAGLRPKSAWRACVGWSAGRVRAGWGQNFSNSCGCGAGVNFAGAGRVQTQNFKSRRSLMDISLLTITSKTFNWVQSVWGAGAAGSLWCGLHCWTVDWAAKSTAVEFDSILSCCPDNGTKSLWSVPAGNKSSFCPTTYRCEAVFQRYNYFWNQAPIPTSTRRRHQMCVKNRRPSFWQTCETNSETRFSSKLVNVGDEEKLLKPVFVSFS